MPYKRKIVVIGSNSFSGSDFIDLLLDDKQNELAEKVRAVIGPNIDIITTPSDDNRSYHVSSEKIRRELNFISEHSIEEAVQDLVAAFQAGKIPNSMTDIKYYNIKTMQNMRLR